MGDLVQRAIHWVAHRLGENHGRVVSWNANGRTMVGFQCAGCGEVSGADCVDAIIDRHVAEYAARKALGAGE